MKEEQWTEMSVYLARKCGWTLEDIGKLTPVQFVDFYNELMFQESVDIWDRQHQMAAILAAIYNTIPKGRGSKVFEAKDFYNVPRPSKENDKQIMSTVDKKATELGIVLPKE